MGDRSNFPKIRDLICNVLYKYIQVCGEATCQNPHKTIDNFELIPIGVLCYDRWSVNQCVIIFVH